ncbi:MAG: DNA repair protein RadA [Bacteroidales bacterium]|nr:DNA repair protein RadA [Bacteroidales bacterium]
MAKVKSFFFCSECGYQSSSWLGKCPECGKWNTFSEEVVQAVKPASSSSKLHSPLSASTPKPISQVVAAETQRIPTGCAEFDRVLGGGIVPGSLILLGGEPGIGKSTLLLQTALNIPDRRILYVSGEESEQQIKMRADRLMGERKAESEECYVVSETVTQRIVEHIEQVRPDILVVDSIQTISSETIDSSAGSISQIRECTAEFQRLAKERSLPILLVGHITKDGNLAGPKVMEHIVDCVLQFEGDRNYGYRMLRSLKNRFGSTAEIGIFEMQGDGLREVSNPSEFLLSQRDENLSGCAVAATLEGARPMFIEVQSLVSSAVYGTPQRNANGFDFRRLSMLLAVLEKRCGFKLGAKDVFLNIAGGIRVSDPAIDLAVACSVLSSNVDMPISPRYCFAAEMGLSGEVRPVSRVEQRITEADRIGFEKIFVSKYNMRGINKKRFGLQIVEVAVIEEVFRALFA